MSNASVVDEHIDGGMLFADCAEKFIYRSRIANVTGNGGYLTILCCDVIRGMLQAFHVAAGDDDRIAAFRKETGCGQTDPCPAARNYRDFALAGFLGRD